MKRKIVTGSFVITLTMAVAAIFYFYGLHPAKAADEHTETQCTDKHNEDATTTESDGHNHGAEESN